MKTITTILLFLALGCSAQEPDMHTYSDSLFNATMDSVINYKDSLFNTAVAYKDSIILRRDNTITALNIALISKQIADTTTISLTGITDETQTIITKQGENITVSIQNGAKRITSIFSEGERMSYFMNDSDTTKTVGSFQLDSKDKVVFYYDPENALE